LKQLTSDFQQRKRVRRVEDIEDDVAGSFTRRGQRRSYILKMYSRVQLFAAVQANHRATSKHGPEIAEKFHDATAPHPLRLLFSFSTVPLK
jgi:hypothetical protein